MTGAACLTAMAALRADAGYVTLAVPESSLAAAEVIALEPVKLAWSDDDALETIVGAADRATALALGPGLGRSPHRRALVRALLEQLDLPAVVDADALFELEPVGRTAPTVLTPHAGELGRLLDRDSEWVDAHRLDAARACRETLRAQSSCSRAPTRSSLPPTEGRSCATSGRLPSRRRARGTCSPESSLRSSRKASSRRPPQLRQPSLTGSPPPPRRVRPASSRAISCRCSPPCSKKRVLARSDSAD